MSDAQNTGKEARDPRPTRLRDALRQARIEAADRTGVVVELRDAACQMQQDQSIAGQQGRNTLGQAKHPVCQRPLSRQRPERFDGELGSVLLA